MDVVRLCKPRTVHGDLKEGKPDDALFILPTNEVRSDSNVLVNNTGFARIADFGLVSIIGLSVVLLSEIFSSGGHFVE